MKMMNYKLKQNAFCCEICSNKNQATARKATIASVNEYHKDGIIKIHHVCSNHIVDLYNKLIK
jgi:hypothetical protein